MHLTLQPRALPRPFVHMHFNVLKSAQHPIWHLARAVKSNNYIHAMGLGVSLTKLRCTNELNC